DNPLEVARDFESKGAKFIHLVDLEGAKDGTTPNIETVKKIAENTNLFTEIGGGIRNIETVEKYLNIGVDRVILGTAAVKDEAFLKETIMKFGDKIAVGIDIKDGFVAIKGWTESSGIDPYEFTEKMQNLGVKYIICTDVSKDGAMKGTNLELYRELSKKFSINITASGGVSSIKDVAELRKMDIYGAIIGKAYYVGAIDLKEAIEVAK
ncbi:MAG: 1-(5-phosphoribosyl)-5-[(5-phosphoribosylamino)methylideneamino]imidazole-4-carboxamide isomerase, partial [Acutalibacteraceae bacterium]|nr:1-(5-phosphoribosyl)-5-[(5-phosphoribosylamino)methylideneamino]imidazole-4-carboxamide isomerase [Acutalibacteraceae bacterium]